MDWTKFNDEEMIEILKTIVDRRIEDIALLPFILIIIILITALLSSCAMGTNERMYRMIYKKMFGEEYKQRKIRHILKDWLNKK